jgi:hypothetical protein
MTTTTEIHTDLTWTPEAWDQFQAIRDQAHKINANWGEGLGNRAHASIGHCLSHVLASGPTRVSKAFDYDGLLIVTPYITMGMVFHADSAEYMSALLLPGKHTPDEIRACFSFAPPSGEWSLHS